jgi:hypothetical protein
VHSRPGEVVDSSRVIEVEMRQHDVPNVTRVESETLNLPERGELLAEVGAQ